MGPIPSAPPTRAEPRRKTKPFVVGVEGHFCGRDHEIPARDEFLPQNQIQLRPEIVPGPVIENSRAFAARFPAIAEVSRHHGSEGRHIPLGSRFAQSALKRLESRIPTLVPHIGARRLLDFRLFLERSTPAARKHQQTDEEQMENGARLHGDINRVNLL